MLTTLDTWGGKLFPGGEGYSANFYTGRLPLLLYPIFDRKGTHSVKLLLKNGSTFKYSETSITRTLSRVPKLTSCIFQNLSGHLY